MPLAGGIRLTCVTPWLRPNRRRQKAAGSFADIPTNNGSAGRNRVRHAIAFLLVLTLHPVSHALANPRYPVATKHFGRSSSPTTRQLQQEIRVLRREVDALQRRRDRTWMSKQEAAKVRGIAEAVLQASERDSQYLKQNATAGYDHGFFIRMPDDQFRLNIRGYIQANYTFALSQNGTAQNINTSGNPTGAPATGDANKFNLRRARLLFSGCLFSPRLIYEISGDFAGSSSTAGYLQMKTTYAGYRWSHWLILRAGVLRVPFTYLNDYAVTGEDFGLSPLVSIPFGAERSIGVDLSGKLLTQHLSYDVQINNGSKASTAGSAIDNRLGLYLRVQYSGGGRLARFRTQAALHQRSHIAWMVGAGAGYESQNSTPSAFPSPQTSLSIAGLSTPDGAGFYPSLPANGSLYRATSDAHVKYEGLDASATLYFQQYNDRPPAGSLTDNFATAFGRRSVYELAYYGEMGYFLVPERWQIIGRAGELLTEFGNKQMWEYGLGVNYYLYGRNARFQTALVYIPNASALSSSSSNAVMNAQNLISTMQFQLKF